jgi:myo-inositol-1(or 4)-monophosphatase
MSASRSLDLDALLRAALDGARAGGAIVADAFGTPVEAREKAPGDWVSQTDTASERAIRRTLADAAPDIPFYGEEEGGDRGPVGWLVDPVDGTANFLHRFPVVAVSVALVADDTPVVGVVHAPILGETYAARRGGGALRNGEPIRVSERPAGQAILATGTPFRAKATRLPEYLGVFERALLAFEGRRRQPRPGVDRGRHLRRLLRSRARAVGRRGRRAARPRGRRARHRLARRRVGLAALGRRRRGGAGAAPAGPGGHRRAGRAVIRC